MSDCLFCRIIEGEIPSKFVYQDDNAVHESALSLDKQGYDYFDLKAPHLRQYPMPLNRASQ